MMKSDTRAVTHTFKDPILSSIDDNFQDVTGGWHIWLDKSQHGMDIKNQR